MITRPKPRPHGPRETIIPHLTPLVMAELAEVRRVIIERILRDGEEKK